jgi:hypothetical protein
MKNLGIAYLNLHQLLTTEYNYRALASRNYTFLHHPGVPVFESEITALKLIQYAVDNNLPLHVNYCSQAYKERIHSKNRRLKALPFAREDCEDATESMYIRNISIQAEKETLEQCSAALNRTGCPPSHWKLDDHSANLVLLSSLLPYIDYQDCKFTLSYFRPYLLGVNASNSEAIPNGTTRKIAINDNTGFLAIKEPVTHYPELTPVFMKSFYKLYIEQQSWEEALRWFSLNYPLRNKDDIDNMSREMNMLKNILPWERLAKGFPLIY